MCWAAPLAVSHVRLTSYQRHKPRVKHAGDPGRSSRVAKKQRSPITFPEDNVSFPEQILCDAMWSLMQCSNAGDPFLQCLSNAMCSADRVVLVCSSCSPCLRQQPASRSQASAFTRSDTKRKHKIGCKLHLHGADRNAKEKSRIKK